MLRRIVIVLCSLLMLGGSGMQAKNVTINWTHTYATADVLLAELIAEYEKQNPGVKIEHLTVDATQFEPKLMVAAAAGVQPDVFRLPSWSTPLYVSKGLVAPVDPAGWGFKQQKDLINLYIPGTLDAYIVGGQLYAIPFEIDTLAVSYRRDIFEEVGLNPNAPPKTWDQLYSQGNTGAHPLPLLYQLVRSIFFRVPYVDTKNVYLIAPQLRKKHGDGLANSHPHVINVG